jgi:hypothetical protein
MVLKSRVTLGGCRLELRDISSRFGQAILRPNRSEISGLSSDKYLCNVRFQVEYQ